MPSMLAVSATSPLLALLVPIVAVAGAALGLTAAAHLV